MIDHVKVMAIVADIKTAIDEGYLPPHEFERNADIEDQHPSLTQSEVDEVWNQVQDFIKSVWHKSSTELAADIEDGRLSPVFETADEVKQRGGFSE